MSKTTALRLLVPVMLLGGALFLVLRSQRQGPVALGDAAPDFTLPCLGCDRVALHDYRRRVVVLNFWATWCPPCVRETSSLQAFSEQMRKAGVAVIGVSVDQDATALQKFIEQQHVSFPVARDPDQVLASRFGTSMFPETYILDRHGRVAEKIIGDIDWQDPRIISFVRTLAGFSQSQTP